MPRIARAPQTKLLVDLDALAHNLSALRALMPAGVGTAAVVKADAYGHGLLPVSRRLKKQGAEFLACAFISEARLLRKASIPGPVMVLVDPGPAQMAACADLKITPVIDNPESLKALAQAANSGKTSAACHLKLDSGMGRLGQGPAGVLELLDLAKGLGGVQVRGVMSHLATSGVEGDAHAKRQTRVYNSVLETARAKGYDLPESSLSASGGVLVPPPGAWRHAGLARPGVALYGGLPSPRAAGRAELRPLMTFSTRLQAVRPIKAGACVSYGCTWTAPHDTWLGVLPVGYADGYPRAASNQGQVLINQRRAPIRGRVCMNLTMVDLTGFDPLPAPGDQVIMLGKGIGLNELADWAGTIAYDITCSLGAANRRRVTAA